MRCEVLWSKFDQRIKEYVEQWYPAKLIETYANGRHHIVCDNGWVCNDAAPECVRFS